MHQTPESPTRQNVRLELASRPEEVSLARSLLSGVAEATSIDGHAMDDIRTAVTEACNNVVQHAYDGGAGPIELGLAIQRDELEVTVRDEGGGMHPWIRTPQADSLGIGLMVIKALSESVEFRDAEHGGMEVQMRFSTPGLQPLEVTGEIPQPSDPFEGQPGSAIAISIAPPSLARRILPRLLGAMAARAHFSTDRISDLQILGDAIVAHCEPVIASEHLCIRVAAAARLVQLSIAPLQPGGADRMLAAASVAGVGGVIERLSDEREVRLGDGEETLLVRMRDHRRRAGGAG